MAIKDFVEKTQEDYSEARVGDIKISVHAPLKRPNPSKQGQKTCFPQWLPHVCVRCTLHSSKELCKVAYLRPHSQGLGWREINI